GTTSPTIPLVVGSGGDPGSATIAAFINTNNGGAASIMIQNDVDNSAVETNEIISRAANRNNGKILFGRDADQSTADNADGFLALYTALNGNNVEAMRIDSDGNVGIGTTSPAELLHINNSTVNAEAAIIVEGGNAGDGAIYLTELNAAGTHGHGGKIVYDGGDNKMYIQTGIEGSLATRMTFLRDSGNVGIGTTSPGAKLDVAGIGHFDDLVEVAAIGEAWFQAVVGSSAGLFGNDGVQTYIYDASNPIGIWAGGTEKMTVQDDGNVGIGTTSPNQKLHVNAVMQLSPTDSPGTCDAAAEGSIYADDSLNEPCYCNGSAWTQFDGGGGC
ncbi:MAG: hypothetical protein P9X22_05055, partial [Candidatus Zapsychrus exili]|nr:hypothetical protein [Candidatus Zapsychrus exili]